MQWAFVLAIVAVTTASLFNGAKIRRTALAFAGCWTVQTAFVLATGIYDPWMFFAATNIIAAIVVLVPPADKAQAAIGSLLAGQALLDCAYGLAGNPDAILGYLHTQTNLGWLILLILGGWNGGIFVRHRGDVGNNPHLANDKESVAK